MPSTPSPLLRLELQATSENLSTWGAKLNTTALTRIEEAIAGVASVVVDGDYALTSTNYAADEARNAVLRTTGAGGTVTLPGTNKTYLVVNDCTGPLVLDAGGDTLTLTAGLRRFVAIIDTNALTIDTTDAGGNRLRNVADATGDQDAVTLFQITALLQANEDASTAYTNSVRDDLQVGALTAAQAEALALINTLFTDDIGAPSQRIVVNPAGDGFIWEDIPLINTQANRWRFRSK